MSTEPMTSSAALLGRLFWLMAGPLFMVVLAVQIAQRRSGWFTILDLFYFVALGGMLFGRWLEMRSGDARTGMGEPATPADFRRYMLITPVIGLALWVTANLLGNYWLGR